MPDTGILTPIAGISMSFAGFAGLFIALRGKREGGLGAFELLELNTIIGYAFAVLFGSLGVIPVSRIVGEDASLRLGGILLLGFAVASALYQRRGGRSVSPIDPLRVRENVPLVLVGLSQAFVFGVVALFPHRELYELGLLFLLATPALVFQYVLRHLGTNVS